MRRILELELEQTNNNDVQCSNEITNKSSNHRSISPSQPGQLSRSLLPSAGREMSTNQSAVSVTLCGCGVKAGWLTPFVDKRVGGR